MYEMNINNMQLFHAYSFIEFTFLSLIFFRLANSIVWRKVIISIFIAFQLYSVLNLIFLENTSEFNSIQRNVEGPILIIYCIVFIRFYAQLEERKRKFYKPMFRLAYGLAVYFSGTLILFTFANEILADRTNDYWTIHSLFNIFLNATYALVLLTAWNRMKKSIRY